VPQEEHRFAACAAMSTVQPTDKTLVNRAGTDYSAPADMSTVQDTDLLLINRSGTDYKCTFADWKASQVKAPDVNTVTLSDVAGGARFTNTAFPVSATMVEDGLPKSDKKLKAYVEGSIKTNPISGPITDVGPKPATYLIERSLRFDGGASLTRATYAGTGTLALWYRSDTPNTAQTIMTGAPPVTPGNIGWNFYIATGVTPAAIGSSFKGYMADIHFIDGQTLTQADFRDATGAAKAFTGSYGTNGFRLAFNDNSTVAALGTDSSGNGRTWTVNGISVTAGVGNDSLVDSPTYYGTNTGAGGEVRGTYAILDPAGKQATTIFSNGNLNYKNPAGSSDQVTIVGYEGVKKQYYEATAVLISSSAQYHYVGDNSCFYSSDGKISGLSGIVTTVAAYTAGDVLGFAVTVGGVSKVYKNGTLVYTSVTTTHGAATGKPTINGFSNTEWELNFGQRPWAYPANATGFSPLVRVPDRVLTFANNSQLANFAAGDSVTEVGNGNNGVGTVKSVNVPGLTMTLEGLEPNWDVGSTVRGPLKAPAGSSSVKLYCKLNAAGAVSDLQSTDPGFTAWTPAGTGPYTGTITFPSTLPTGNPPDTDMPAGTTLTVEVEASNATGSDSAKSNTITPAP
jgi:hypothetical protein